MVPLILFCRAVGLIIGLVLCFPLIIFIPMLAMHFGDRLMEVAADMRRYNEEQNRE